MKTTKRILSILILAAMVISLAACSATRTDTHTATETSTSTETNSTAETSTTFEETTTETSTTSEDDPKVEYITHEMLLEMTDEELSILFNTMSELSQEQLSANDMFTLGHNFYTAWWVADLFNWENISDIEYQATQAFNNVYSQALEQCIPLERLFPWGDIPVLDIQAEYFGSYQFGDLVDIGSFDPFDYLEELEEALIIAEVISNNRIFDKNFYLAKHFLQSQFLEIQEMGVERLTKLSMMSSQLSSYYNYTYSFCLLLEDNQLCTDLLTEEMMYGIRENVLKNQFYDFVDKYTIFCNSADTSVASQAFQRLMNLAANPTAETAALIKKVADNMWDGDAAAQLLEALGS